jgi:hypothetical protein
MISLSKKKKREMIMNDSQKKSPAPVQYVCYNVCGKILGKIIKTTWTLIKTIRRVNFQF